MPTLNCNMGFKQMFKWIVTTTVQPDNQIWTVSPTSQCSLNNEYSFKSNDNRKDWKLQKCTSLVPGVPHIQASEIFEIGCVAGTEDRYLELVSAEWQNTRVSLRRHTHPACQDAIRADIEVLAGIRHPNVLLLMATTHTDEYGPISILEPVECTLYNYIHEQGEGISIQGIAQVGIKLADALKYCHMRGYIHGAISSHCVYFTSHGIIKLGGWELAIIENNKIQRDYEECLRTEVFKWQAPEFFHGFALSTKTDVYGLSLLLWEMGTARVPWNGCNRPHIERQYSTRKRGVIMDLHSLPPCLKKILESGLQLDMTKRTLDIDKIQRTLHRLLMFKEEEEATFINESNENNNNLVKNTYTIKRTPSSPSEDMIIIRKPSTRQSYCHMMEEKSFKQFSKSNKIQCNKRLNFENDIKKEKIFVQHCSRDEAIDDSNITKENKTDEELYSAARSNIKRLKEIIANKRESFFRENNSSISICQTLSSKDSVISSHTNNSPDYVLCKPASHTTNMEFKCRKLPAEGTITKSPQVQQFKLPYMDIPTNIRDAIVPRKSLYSNPENFYESTLWRKEKLICESRMGYDNKKCEQIWPLLQRSFTNVSTDDNKVEYSKPDSTSNNNNTFIIENVSEVAEDNHTENVEDSFAKCKTCNLYDSNNILRRRSLPAKLNQLKIIHSPGFKKMLKKQYAHTTYSQDNSNNTIEDLYIDDEFGSYINENLLLLNDDLQSINDYFYDNRQLQTTEL